MTSRIANDGIIIRVLPKSYFGVTKKISSWKIVIFIVIVLHGSVIV